MRSRVLGSVIGGVIGAFIGTGTGIVGGVFGAVAGFLVFTGFGALWGFSAGPDLARQIERWKTRKK